VLIPFPFDGIPTQVLCPLVTGVIGTLQALEVIKVAVGMQRELPHLLSWEIISSPFPITFAASYSQKLLLFDAVTGTFRVVKLRGRSLECAANGNSPTITGLIDYVQFCGAGPHDKASVCLFLFLAGTVSADFCICCFFESADRDTQYPARGGEAGLPGVPAAGEGREATPARGCEGKGAVRHLLHPQFAE